MAENLVSIPPLNAALPITINEHGGDLPAPWFVTQLNNNISALQASINALYALQTQATANQAAAAVAQQTANSPPAPSGEQGSATLFVIPDNTWTAGPVVPLTGVAAGNLTASVTLLFPAGSSLIRNGQPLVSGQVQCEFRIVEVYGGDTVVFPTSGMAQFVVYSAPYGGSGISNLAVDDLAAFSSPRTSTGGVSYRLDLRVITADFSVDYVSAYLFVHRA